MHVAYVDRGVQFEMLPTRQPWGGFMALVMDSDRNIPDLDAGAVMHSGDAV